MPHTKKVELIYSNQINHGVLENVLGYLLAQASIPTNKIFKNEVFKNYGFNKLEYTTLILINSNENLTLKNLVNVLNIPASNLSLILDKFEKQHLITREKSLSDQRVQLLKLTSKGVKIARELEKKSLTMESDLLSALSQAEQSMLFELLTKIIKKRKP